MLTQDTSAAARAATFVPIVLAPSATDGAPDIVEFVRHSKLLFIDPVSGAWLVSSPQARLAARQELLRLRARWRAQPHPDTEAAPLDHITVPIKNKYCNLRCDYCFAESENKGAYPPVATILHFIRLVEAMHPDRLRHFVFHGGEPLIDWRAVEQVVAGHRGTCAPERGRSQFHMVTNGTLITPAIAQRMRELDIHACISLDGPQEVHDKYRRYLGGRGSFDKTLRGYRLLQDAGHWPGTLSTIVDPADLVCGWRFFRDAGFGSAFLRPLRWQGRALPLLRELVGETGEEDYQRQFAEQMMQVADEVITHNRARTDKFVEHGLAIRLTHLIRKERPYMCLRSPCGAASGHKLGLDGNGNVFPCDTMVEFPALALGNVATIADADQLRKLIAAAPVTRCLKERRVEKITQCRQCHVQRYCGGECSAASYARFGALNREGDRCTLERTLFVELLWKIAENPAHIEDLCPGSLRAGNLGLGDLLDASG